MPKRIGIGLVLAALCATAGAQIGDATRRAALSAVPQAAAPTPVAPAPAPPEASATGLTLVNRPFTPPDPVLPFKAIAAPKPPVAVEAPRPPPRWEVQIADVSLLNTFQRWALQAGYRVKWDAARHVLIDAPGVVTGTFEEAVEQVLSSPGIRNGEYPLEVCYYPNQPPLARITRRGEQVKDCN